MKSHEEPCSFQSALDRSWRSTRLLTLIVTGFLMLCAAIPTPTAAQLTESQQAATVKRYPLRGKVLSIQLSKQQITVQHEDIPGFMPGMTMPFHVKDASALKRLAPGDQISAVLLVRTADESYEVDEIRVLRPAAAGTSGGAVQGHPLQLGDSLPDAVLTNQDNKSVHLSSYRGKLLLVTFIYTRCPMPTACPMITSHFARVHALLSADAKLAAQSHLLSITLDPTYDTPQVLRRFGLAYLHDHPEGFAHWEFLRSEPAELQKLASTFGLEYHQEDHQILHTVRTLLIDKNGRVLRTWDGSSWKPQEIVDVMASAAPGAKR